MQSTASAAGFSTCAPSGAVRGDANASTRSTAITLWLVAASPSRPDPWVSWRPGQASADQLRHCRFRAALARRSRCAICTATAAKREKGVWPGDRAGRRGDFRRADEAEDQLARWDVSLRGCVSTCWTCISRTNAGAGFAQMAANPLVGFGFETGRGDDRLGMIIGSRVSLSMLAASARVICVLCALAARPGRRDAGVAGYVGLDPAVGAVPCFTRCAGRCGGARTLVFASPDQPGASAGVRGRASRCCAVHVFNARKASWKYDWRRSRCRLLDDRRMIPIGCDVTIQFNRVRGRVVAGLIAGAMCFVLSLVVSRALPRPICSRSEPWAR